MYIAIVLVVYLAIGVFWVVDDFRQPVINQPEYVYHPRAVTIVLFIVTWPVRATIEFRHRWRRRRARRGRMDDDL